MLKTLRITSLAAVVLAVCGVLLIVFLGLREDPAIIAYLNEPGVISRFMDRAGNGGQQDVESPLVAQARLFANLIDPPPPPERPKPPVREQPVRSPVETVRTTPTPPPEPKNTVVDAKFTLLATVMCEENPSRSMVLLRQAGNKDEWFWQGDKIGHLEVQEVRDGTAVFTQAGGKEQILSVPPKPQTKSLLKAQASTPTRPVGTAGSISVLVDAETGEPITDTAAAGAVTTDAVQPQPSTQVTRPSLPTGGSLDVAARRQEASDRIRRVRTIPRQPDPAEQANDLGQSIQMLQQAMNEELSAVDEAQRQEESEAWMKLIEVLQSEKQRMEEMEGSADEQADSADTEQEPATEETPAETPDEE